MKKLVTSFALVFAMLGLGVGVFAGCGNKDEFKNAQTITADEFNGFMNGEGEDKVETDFGAYSVLIESQGAKISCDLEVVDATNKNYKGKMTVYSPAMSAGEQTTPEINLTAYIKDYMVYIDGNIGVDNVKTKVDVSGDDYLTNGTIQTIYPFFEMVTNANFEGLLEGLAASDADLENVVIKKLVNGDTTKFQLKNHFEREMTAGISMACDATVVVTFDKNAITEMKSTVVTSLAGQSATAYTTIKGIEAVSFDGVNFDSWNS